ncbi:MAG TPA: alpha-N-arabinofuranosidase [Chloroflexi bacterium]|nr:alpha-N-arabinofuranosidase [Chloroflexota bacterium]
MNTIKIDPTRAIGELDRNVFGGFAEHLGRCIYGGIYEENSPLADENGFRRDVMEALKRLRMPIIRYPGGNFVSGYRWMDGIGPKDERPARAELAWGTVESNRFGTDEFVTWCRQLGAEPYLAVNCGDGSMREARDWVEYCNGTGDTALVQIRRRNGYEAPHNVKYWGIGNEVDGPWQMGMKTPQEYARAYTEFGKLMKMVDPNIRLIASWTSGWFDDWVERGQLLLEQAADLVDYMAIHWYVGNRTDDFSRYMALSELFEERLIATEGLIAAMRNCRKITKPIPLAVDEWNVWYRTGGAEGLEEVYNLEDALVVALQLNAFIRHAYSVKMANLAQIVNVIAPILTRPEGLVLQSIFYPFEIYSQNAGATALDVMWEGDTFQAGDDQPALRVLDVAATVDAAGRQVAVFVVNRSLDEAAETRLVLQEGEFGGVGVAHVVNGPDPKAANSFDSPDQVVTRSTALTTSGRELTYTFEPHSVTALVFSLT